MNTETTDVIYCCARSYVSGGRCSSRCSRRMVVERNGKPYCKQHDPEQVAVRREWQVDKAKQKYAADQQRRVDAQALVDQLGVGKPHYDALGLKGYTGWIVLSASEVQRLITRLERGKST